MITIMKHKFLVILSFAVISYLNGLLAINMINPVVNLPILPDIGFEYLPHIPSKYPNLLLLFGGIYFATRFFRLKNLEELINMFRCITILFTLRILTFTVTIVPPSTIDCYERNSTSPIEWNVIKYLVFNNDNTCIDYMFSGHACYFVMFLLFTLKFSEYKLEKILFSLYTLIGLLSIISGHIHYTVDVIVGVALSIWCFKLYDNIQNCQSYFINLTF